MNSRVMMKHGTITAVGYSLFIDINVRCRFLICDIPMRATLVTWFIMVKVNSLNFDVADPLWTFQVPKEPFTLGLSLFYFVYTRLRITLNVKLFVLLAHFQLQGVFILWCASHLNCFFNSLWSIKLLAEYVFLDRDILQW